MRISIRSGRAPWVSRLVQGLLGMVLAACGGGGGGAPVAGDVPQAGAPAPGPSAAPPGSAAGPATPSTFTASFLTAYDEGSCRGCVNAPGEAAFTILHAGRIAVLYSPGAEKTLQSPFDQSRANGLNDAGQVVGAIAMATNEYHAARWTPVGPGPVQPLDLGAPAGGASEGQAINASGQVAGTSRTGVAGMLSGPERAFFWTEEAGRMDLGTPPSPFVHSRGLLLNASGRVAGQLRTEGGSPQVHAFSWTAATGMVDLGTFGGPDAVPTALNDAGAVAGQADLAPDAGTGEPAHHAFVWTAAAGLRDLGTLGGRQSSAAGINASGLVAGQADTAVGGDPRPHAFLWDGGSLRDLGTLGGATSAALAINDAGQVVGTSALAEPNRAHAFIWTAETGMVDLNSRLVGPRLPDLTSATAISRNGAILAMSSTRGLELLTPSGGRFIAGPAGAAARTPAA